MRAIEFKAKIQNGMIQIPKKYRKLAGQLARVIILTEEDKFSQPVQDIDAIQSIVDKLRAKKVFRDIKNPTVWQRLIRDEWNERIG